MNCCKVVLYLTSIVAHAQTPVWVSSTMLLRPLPYPHLVAFSGEVRDGKPSLCSATFVPMEMQDLVFPRCISTFRCKVQGRSGIEYQGKVCNSWFDVTPSHEEGGWNGSAPVKEEPAALRIYQVGMDNSETLCYEYRASTTVPVIEIKVQEQGNGKIAWRLGEGLPVTAQIWKPDIALTLTKGVSWADGGNLIREYLISSADLSTILKPGIDATIRFILDYDLRHFEKYYTVGKGFSDTPPNQ